MPMLVFFWCAWQEHSWWCSLLTDPQLSLNPAFWPAQNITDCFLNCVPHLFPSRYATLYIRYSEGFSMRLHLLLQILTCAHLETGFICVFLHCLKSNGESLKSRIPSAEKSAVVYTAPKICLLAPRLHKIRRKTAWCWLKKIQPLQQFQILSSREKLCRVAFEKKKKKLQN